jgi:predicted nuclease of predicted toxin-antitoxin system
MKLLFDENLPPQLSRLLATLFPQSQHVRECGLRGCPDEDIWDYARDHGFVLVSKDSDFQQRSLLYGHPPKIVWLRIGNCNRDAAFQMIVDHERDIRNFGENSWEAILILSR